MSKIRTFLAVSIPSAVRTRAVDLIGKLATTDAKVKWVEEQNLHWTLKFLGDVDNQQIPRVCQIVQLAVERLAPFRVQAHGAGAFPNPQRPRTVWLGVTQGEAEFVQLHDVLEPPLAELGFREERRRFRPHMTLGRVRGGPRGIAELGQKIAEHTDFDAGTMRIDEVAVFSSDLDRGGPTYQILGRAKLSG